MGYPPYKIHDFSSCSKISIQEHIDFVKTNCFIEKSQVEEDDDDFAICYMTAESLTCLDPAKTTLVYGVIVPWIFIVVSCILLVISLRYDWKHNQKCFKHMTENTISQH